MQFKDFKAAPKRGYFKIECIDASGNIIDVFENHNLITHLARVQFAKSVMGVDKACIINNFRLGNKGHQGDDVLVPKDSTTGFNETRTKLFSEELSGITNKISFVPSGSTTQTSAQVTSDGSNRNSTVDITLTGVETNEPCVTYTINISQDAFNGDNTGIVYTEAGLYSDDNLIAVRTFKGKIKEDTVSFRIIWSLYF